jgi:D-glycero-alpha-D-manno-heptose-7-phosphate kinase
MIISKAPLRISFAGGGSDLPAFYRKRAGAVVSTTIDKYVYVGVNKKFGKGLRVSYAKTENVGHTAEIQHPIVRESLKHFGIDDGIEIVTVADIPGEGTGLGSSSSFTVALCRALAKFLGKDLDPAELSQLACQVEIECCGSPIGKQDQYAAAYEGLNLIRFYEDDTVSVERMEVDKNYLRQIQDHALLLYTGRTRSASSILQHQQKTLLENPRQIERAHELVDFAFEFHNLLLQEAEPKALADVLHRSWIVKRDQAQGISDKSLDSTYQELLYRGAWGGKLLGAGGGGFFFMLAPVEARNYICSTMVSLEPLDISFFSNGHKSAQI